MVFAAIFALLFMFGKLLGPMLSFALKIAFTGIGLFVGTLFYVGRACAKELWNEK
ncbi:hypothetical protein ACFFU8_09170 [Chromobacterium piscinae]|uniref:hypothetical protein n=1 Tax=Chromobacterium piscinae TaxID=686831 RepID=UPI001E4038C7|nr:hypothetical protein [Chromobacterium piscinae]MCD5327926.1 hypothetical protein [Chromobacterium piscinae]